MRNTSTAKSHTKSQWLALLLGVAFAAVTAQSCSIDTSRYTFVPDDEFADASTSGGANGGGPQAGSSNNGGGMTSGGDAGMGGAGGAAGGEGGASSGECTPGEHACTPDGHLQTCKAGDPPAFDAGVACGEGKCSASLSSCLKCVPGDFQCANNVLQQCNIFGSAFEDAAICDSKAACSASGQKGFCVHCKPGVSSCEASLVHVLAATDDDRAEYPSTDLVTCNLDGSGTDTSQVCVAEATLCDPVAKKCSSCVPGTYQCDGNSLNVCNSDGSGYSNKASCQQPNGACNATTGKCEPAACNNGSYQCQGNVLQVCNNGAYTQLDVCDTKDLCDANNGRCQKCNPNVRSCQNGDVQACAFNSGENLPVVSTLCESGTCVASANSASCTCKQASSYCNYDGDLGVTSCINGLTTYVGCVKDPTTGTLQVCNPRFGKCTTCISGRFQCDTSGVLQQCSDDGSTWRVVSDCAAAGKQCDAGRGLCLGAQPGRFYCDDKGDLYSVGYERNTHKIVSTLADHCGSPSQCSPYDGACRSKRCVIGQSTCSGADVYSCDTGERRNRTSTRCSSAARCQDGFGCVKALAIAAGDAHTCVVVAGADANEGDPGYVMCWGANESGQLGDGSPLYADSKEARPVLIGPGPGDGSGSSSSIPRLNNYFTEVSAGKNFTCAELSIPNANGESRVACWGSNEKGQLGAAYADPGAHNGPFTLVTDSASNDKGVNLHGVSCGAEFACALDGSGMPWCWGANESGQLGNGSKDAANAATPISGVAFAQLSAGARHVCGIKSDGTVWCWGDGTQGQLGNALQKSSSVPILVGKVAASPDRPMALGNDFSLVLGAKGSKNPSAWGANSFGQLGNASTTGSGAPSDLLGLLSADFVVGGALFSGSSAEHACARLADRLFCWGANVFGEVGDGTTIDRSSPTQIFDAKTDLTKLAASTHAVAVGGRHTCAITAKGDVLCWGANHRQQLGNAAVTPQRVPLRSF